MEPLQVAGVAGVVIIPLILQVAKHHGLDHRWTPAAALILGVLLSVLVHVSGASAVFATWLEVIVTGLMTGFASAGLYSGQKAVRGQ